MHGYLIAQERLGAASIIVVESDTVLCSTQVTLCKALLCAPITPEQESRIPHPALQANREPRPNYHTNFVTSPRGGVARPNVVAI